MFCGRLHGKSSALSMVLTLGEEDEEEEDEDDEEQEEEQ